MIALFSVLIAGCSNAPTAVAPHEDVAIDPALVEDSSGLTYAPAVSLTPRPYSLVVSGTVDENAVVELRAFRETDDGMWTGGWPIASTSVAAGDFDATLSLPVRPPMRDRDTAAPYAPVVYAVSLRAVDSAGNPTVWLGLADAVLTYVKENPDTANGAQIGWNVAEPGTVGPTYYPLAQGVEATENLVGLDEVTLGGSPGIAWAADMHIGLYNVRATTPPAAPVYDQPSLEMWSMTVSLPPTQDAWVDHPLLEGGMYGLFAYQDTNASNSFTPGVESLAGAACWGNNPVAVGWLAEPLDLETAFFMRQVGVTAGWNVAWDDGSHMVPVDPTAFTSLEFSSTCGATTP